MTEPDPDRDEPDEARPDDDQPRIAPPEVAPRRYPSTVGGVLYLLVLATTVVGVAWVAAGPWRTGVRIVAAALLAAALLRLTLRTRDAGMLAVRNRLFDTVLLTVVGGSLMLLAAVVPDQP